MTEIRIGYARCSTDRQDLAAQQEALVGLGVSPDRIYTDKGLTDSDRQRPGLAQALAVVRQGDTLVVPKMFFNVLATFAEFEGDLIRLRTREGMAIARAKGKLRGKQPKLSDKQQKELCRMHGSGEYSISDLAELFSVSRPTVYRTLSRGK
ncbi:recombinase family protein [Klebsiella grimontii]|uniref:recombinase family protein n=1 Tax=Klebsiella grimontii TaxID=2058152 RepID=UPI001CCF4AEB|nr:recombinase family protein [Klebsiella grimontii]MBZ7673930.1 recombinase family protein [Klebsiella grimontii]